MHADWTAFLETQNLLDHLPKNAPCIASLSHLSVLSVTGKDAAVFLQGQTTCDINALTDSTPMLGAFCNAKGRTLSTFIIIKYEQSYLLLLTNELIDTIKKKLQMYILRADVQLDNLSDQLCITGLHNTKLTSPQPHLYSYPQHKDSFLYIAESSQSQLFCTQLIDMQAAQFVTSNAWTLLDIKSGIPWLNLETTEKFIPQMLNLDKLEGISFTKGCYTGQEIVARTHYLGKNKRALYSATCQTKMSIASGCSISEQARPDDELGTVILSAHDIDTTHLLIVLKDQALEGKILQLNNQNRDKITLN